MTAVIDPDTRGTSGFLARNWRCQCLSGFSSAILALQAFRIGPVVPVTAKDLPLKCGGSHDAIADQSPASTISAPASAPS